MAKAYQITDSEKFNAIVSRLDVMVNNSGRGNVQIIDTTGKMKEIDGEHGDRDYEEDYGFILINKNEKQWQLKSNLPAEKQQKKKFQ